MRLTPVEPHPWAIDLARYASVFKLAVSGVSRAGPHHPALGLFGVSRAITPLVFRTYRGCITASARIGAF